MNTQTVLTEKKIVSAMSKFEKSNGKMPDGSDGSDGLRSIAWRLTGRKLNDINLNKNDMVEYVRNIAFSLSDKNMKTSEIAEVLCVHRQTVAAWLAHRTMGTY